MRKIRATMELQLIKVTRREMAEWAQSRLGSESKSKVMCDDDIFTFGKHKGKTLKEVIKKDAGYVNWCIREGIFEIEERYYDD
jgi:hypothetical protein